MERLLAELAQEVRSRYYGKYRGYVVDNRDPDKLGRLRLTVPAVLGETVTDWALPCLPFGGLAEQGLFTVPENRAAVWVEFEAGDVHRPIWTGTFWQASAAPPTEAQKEEPTTRLLKTPSGHILQFDDESGSETIRLAHPTEAELNVDKNGTIALTDAQGSTLVLDAEAGKITVEDKNGNSMTMDSSGVRVADKNGNSIEMAASGITVSGQKIVIDGTQVMVGGVAGEPVIKGQSFLTLFATHVHTCTAPGAPSSPPIPQGEMSTLSMGVKTS